MTHFNKFLFLVSLFLISSRLNAQLDLNWAQYVGGESNDAASGAAIDKYNNIYAVGNYTGNVDFNYSSTKDTLLTGINDVYAPSIFVSKTDSSGALLWARGFGAGYGNNGMAITTDSLQNVYIVGQFSGTIDFNPDPNVTNELTYFKGSGSTFDIFILKLDTDGNFLWVKQLGNAQYVEYAEAVKVDPLNNVYVVGNFRGLVDFNPSPTEATILNGTGPSSRNVFILKLNSSGDFQWVRQVDKVYGQNLAVDGVGNVYVTGIFGDATADFDTGASTFNLEGQIRDNFDRDFLLKLNTNGDFQWAKQNQGSGKSAIQTLTLDPTGNLFIVGIFLDTLDANFGLGTAVHYDTVGSNIPNGLTNSDMYIAKYDAEGNYIWSKTMGGTAIILPTSVAINKFGKIYISGTVRSAVYGYNPNLYKVDFDPSAQSDSLVPKSWDFFVCKLDGEGNYDWAKLFGYSDPESYNSGNTILLDKDCHFFLSSTAGTSFASGSGNPDTHIYEPADYDPSSDVFDITTNGYLDIFLGKYTDRNCCSAPPTALITSVGNTTFCMGDSVVLNSNTDPSFLKYNWIPTGDTLTSISAKTSGNYQVAISNDCGFDTSSVVVVVTNPSPTIAITVTDSTICAGESTTLTASGATTYSWLPIESLSASTGTSVTATPTSTTTYIVKGKDPNIGCEGTTKQKITVNALPEITVKPDFEIAQGDTAHLEVTGTAGTYLWSPTDGLSCTTCSTPTVVPVYTTNYCVEVTDSTSCVAKKCTNVKVNINCGQLFVPNSFSPNGDTHNDVLEVKVNPTCVSEYEFSIYDRWGEKVFESIKITESWDGKYEGKELDNAVFVYYLKVTLLGNTTPVEKKGNVSIIK